LYIGEVQKVEEVKLREGKVTWIEGGR